MPARSTAVENWFRAAIERNPNVVTPSTPTATPAWSFESRWNDGHPAAGLFVETMAPVTAEAHAALWHTVLTTDLVGTVRTYAMPIDDPLPFLLTDQRLVRTTDLNDNVLVQRARRPGAVSVRASTARTTTWSSRSMAPAGGSARPACRRVRARPDLVTDRAGLGALLLGGVAPTALVAGRRLRGAQRRRPAPRRRPVRGPPGALLPDGVLTLAGSFAAVSDRISTAEVVHVARLARLALSPDEIDRLTSQLGAMLDHFADIDGLALDDVEPMTQPYPLTNVLREDVELPGLDRDEVLAAAPDVVDGRFRVPPIIGLAE